jgi:tetratricopeptide (TPR) repeat protein
MRALMLLAALVQEPDSIVRRLSRAAAELHRQERYQEALDSLNRAVAINPRAAGARFNRALTRSELGDVAGAVAELDSVIALRPAMAPAWTERGAARALLGRVAEARADWARSLAIDSTYIWPHFYRGQAAFAAGDFAEAAEAFDVVTARESLLSAHLWRLLSYQRLGRRPPTLPAYHGDWPGPIAAYLQGRVDADSLVRTAIALRLPLDDRRLAASLFFIGNLHLARGRTREARQAFERGLALRVPRHAEIVAMEAELGRLNRAH